MRVTRGLGVCLSHRSQPETERGVGPLEHSVCPDICSNCLAIWMKASWVVCDSMSFHTDKQLFQVDGTGDWTTDHWITTLYPYNTMGTGKKNELIFSILLTVCVCTVFLCHRKSQCLCKMLRHIQRDFAALLQNFALWSKKWKDLLFGNKYKDNLMVKYFFYNKGCWYQKKNMYLGF